MICKQIQYFKEKLPSNVTLVAVSKTKSISDIQHAIKCGQVHFGENKVQELVQKAEYFNQNKDIQWHFIGHLQTNKVKYILPFVSLIQSVDSIKLFSEINKRAQKINKIIPCLIQIQIAQEETKFGFSFEELETLLTSKELKQYPYIDIKGFMGMATNSKNKILIKNEFKKLNQFFLKVKQNNQLFNNINLTILSMGMSNDYGIAIEEGSTMVRLGSSIFGNRNYKINS